MTGPVSEHMHPQASQSNIGRGELNTEEQDGLIQHVAIFLADGNILSDETFRLVKFSGQESISQPFQFQLELYARTQPGIPLNFSFHQILTRPVTVGINLPGCDPRAFARAVKGSDEEELTVWNGIATDLSMAAPGVYHLTMKPALHRLSLTNRYSLHRQLNIRSAIEDILGGHGITTASGKKVGTGPSVCVGAISGADNPAVARTQDWLQAGESDLDLLNRLMQKAFIYYYFEHSATGHRIVFANKPAYPNALPEGKTLRYIHTSEDPLGAEQDDVILNYSYSQTMSTTGISNVLARQEPAWEEDTVAQYNTFKASSSEQLGDLPFRRFQICQYGGSDGEVKWDTNTCEATRSTAATSLSASSHCPLLRAGHTFTLGDAGIPEITPYPIRPTLAGQQFVLNSVSHTAELGGSYHNQFQATESSGQVAPFSLHDTQQGAVLARVVKHDNGTYPKDWRYYQKSAFDPEMDKLKDNNAAGGTWQKPKGVYVQFATDGPGSEPVWIKLAQHMLTVPELGVVVMVSRANDHSELPEIQSIIQNNGHMTVTPSRWTANTSVGCNYNTSYSDSRAVSYGFYSSTDLPTAKAWVDDKYNKCEPNVKGWFGKTHFKSVSWSKGNSSSWSTAENGRADVMSESKSIGSTYSEHDAKWSKNISVVDHSWSHSTSITTFSDSTIKELAKSISKIKKSDSHSTIDTSISWSKVGYSDSYSEVTTSISESHVTTSNSKSYVDDSTSFSDVGTSDSTNHVGSSKSHSTTGTSVSTSTMGASTHSGATGVSNANTATGISNNNSATGISVNISATGISTSASATGISAHASATGISASASATGISKNASLTGISSNNSLTGVSNNTAATGVSSSLNATGAHSGINATGSSTDISATGSSTRINATGSNTSISATGSTTDISATGSSTNISVSGSARNITVCGSMARLDMVNETKLQLTTAEMKLISGLMAMI